ncbi:hybrid sensor histidine kinase/response regulator [Gilvimarinus sp. F26214L]|uniref:hybrid sensor histidine kinase/response regulator n=1 Tax=Gilvimarinus sp. DZF01 TaxID=3461371 RepID=UPI0040457873
MRGHKAQITAGSTAAALRESEESFRTLADSIAQLAWMTDRRGRMLWTNRAWQDYTGTEPQRNAGRCWQGTVHPDYARAVDAKFNRHLKSGEPWEDTFPIRSKEGAYHWFLSQARPIRNDAGAVVRWLGTSTDITEQRQVKEMLQETAQRKDEYLAMLGHELRNPLAGIAAATQLAKLAHTDDPRLQHAIHVLERQSNHISRIVDGLLEVSRIARGKIHLDRRPVDLVHVLKSVLDDRVDSIEKRGLQLRQHYPRRPVMINGDWVRLVQVFDNLIGNAIKFTQSPGTIEVRLDEEEDLAKVHVRDTGVGIRPEILNRIFEPFLQEWQDVSRTTGGLGLGLSLAKNLVELHEGRIEAHSDGAGKGAEFLVCLPLIHKSRTRQTPVPEEHEQTRVLIVEDNEDAADTLATLLELKGHEVRTARTAPEGLDILAHEDVDIILCDIGLPGMSGYDFARRVRADDKLQGIPLIATTGYGQPEDRRRSAQAGFDEHITKPVRLELLEKILSGSGHHLQ